MKLASRTTAQVGFIRVDQCEFQYENLAHYKTLKRDVVIQPDAVAVLPYNKATKQVMLVKQFRAAKQLTCTNPLDDGLVIEACAGYIDQEEKPIEAMRREIREELGLELKNSDLTPLRLLAVSPGFTTHHIYLFLAYYSEENKKYSGGGLESENERIEVLELDINEAFKTISAGGADMKTYLLFKELMERL